MSRNRSARRHCRCLSHDVHDRNALGCRSREEHGFTVIEAVIASVLLTTALVSLAQLFAVATAAAANARDVTRATLAATQKVEEVRAAAFPATTIQESDIVDQRFRRLWTITPYDDGSGASVEVDVMMVGRAGPVIHLETIRTRR